MYPANPFLQLVPARVSHAIARVRERVWSPAEGKVEIFATAAQQTPVGLREAMQLPRVKVTSFPHHYGKLWDQRWFLVRLPKSRGYFRWDDQAEATLYVKGKAFYGLDVAHRYAPLPQGVDEVWVEAVVCQTAIWHPEASGLDCAGSRLDGAGLWMRDDLAWDVLHDLLVLEDLMREELKAAFPARHAGFYGAGIKPAMGVIPPLLRRLLRALDGVIDAMDAGGLPAAKRVLSRVFREFRGDSTSPSALLTGHAHIDLVWLWPERVGEFKAVHTFATANRLMDLYPEFQFAYSQPASYEAVGKRCPEILRESRRRMDEGRWEAEGVTYVESDTLLACGEALARSFLIGQESFEALHGKKSSILWLPDVFGYAGCLPQLIREAGADSFFTTKLAWNAVTPFPHSSFVWAGSDGSEVVSHLCQSGGYNQAVTVAELRGGAAGHRECDVHPEFLAPSGFGDGGGGVTEEMCERARRMRNLAGVPRSGWGRLDGFFRRLGKLRSRLPVFRGELYLEYHRGTYTTHGDIKAAMRAAERSLQVHEAARCVTSGLPLPTQNWKRLIFAQFHDYIPGSSIHEVYVEANQELKLLSDAAQQSASRELEGRGGSRSLFNPLPVARIHHHKGKALLLPPLAGAPLDELTVLDEDPMRVSPREISNGRCRATFDSFGRISALSVDGKPLPLRAPANSLFLFPDRPQQFDAWDIDRQALSAGRADNQKARAQVEISEAWRGTVAFQRPLGKKSRITIRYSLDAHASVLRIEYDLDWNEENTLLKAVFPTEFMGRDARFGAPFGSVRRPQLGGYPQAEAMWEVPGSRWAVVTDDAESEGLFVVTESKYGFSCRDGSLGVSLVRSVKITNEDRGAKSGSHPEPLRRTLAPHVLSDVGPHRIRIAVGRFDPAAPREEHPAAQAECLFTPPVEYRGESKDCGFLGISGGDSLQPVWAAPSGAGRWTLRLHETLGRSGEATILLAPGWKAKRVTLSGEVARPAMRGNRVRFSAYQVLSLQIAAT